MQRKAKIFMNNRSQAVRLPKDFQLRTQEVFIRRLSALRRGSGFSRRSISALREDSLRSEDARHDDRSKQPVYCSPRPSPRLDIGYEQYARVRTGP
jgi:hypothetical protein